jgi:hypothetical protein
MISDAILKYGGKSGETQTEQIQPQKIDTKIAGVTQAPDTTNKEREAKDGGTRRCLTIQSQSHSEEAEQALHVG